MRTLIRTVQLKSFNLEKNLIRLITYILCDYACLQKLLLLNINTYCRVKSLDDEFPYVRLNIS